MAMIRPGWDPARHTVRSRFDLGQSLDKGQVHHTVTVK